MGPERCQSVSGPYVASDADSSASLNFYRTSLSPSWLHVFDQGLRGSSHLLLALPEASRSMWFSVECLNSAYLLEYSTRTEGRSESESRSVVSNSLRPHGLYSPWNSPGHNTGVGSLSLLQGIFSTQGSNPGLPHCRWIIYQLNHKGCPTTLEWVVYPFSRGSSLPRNQTGVSCICRQILYQLSYEEGRRAITIVIRALE